MEIVSQFALYRCSVTLQAAKLFKKATPLVISRRHSIRYHTDSEAVP